MWIHWYYVFQQRLLVAVKIYKCGCQNIHVQNWSKLIQYDKSRLTAYMNYKIGVNLLPICISWLYTICVFGMLLATFTTSPALSFTFLEVRLETGLKTYVLSLHQMFSPHQPRTRHAQISRWVCVCRWRSQKICTAGSPNKNSFKNLIY